MTPTSPTKDKKKSREMPTPNTQTEGRPISYKLRIISDSAPIKTATAKGEKVMEKEAGFLNLKNIGLKQNGAYQLAQNIKTDSLKYGMIKKLDLSDNKLEDEGIIYVSVALKSCSYLETLIISNNQMSEYGLRMLLETLNYTKIKNLDISGNHINTKGAEYLAHFLQKSNSTVEYLNVNSSKLDIDGSKLLGIALSGNTKIKKAEISWNNIRGSGAVLLTRGITTNNTLEEVYLCYNSFGGEGCAAIADCITYNKSLKLISLRGNLLQQDCAIKLSGALATNTTLKSLFLDDNNLTTDGVYEILDSLNNDSSNLEFLSLKNIQVHNHIPIMVDIIKMKRKFNCIYGPLIKHNRGTNLANQVKDPQMKLAVALASKNMTLSVLFQILNTKDGNAIDKKEFIRRLKLFEPNLLTKGDLEEIARKFTTDNKISYENLLKQSKKSNNDEKECDIHFKKAQLNKKDEKNMLTMKKTIRVPYHSSKDPNSSVLLNGVLINNSFIGDRTYLSAMTKKRHEKCLISDYNYYDDSFLNAEKENYKLNMAGKVQNQSAIEKKHVLRNETPKNSLKFKKTNQQANKFVPKASYGVASHSVSLRKQPKSPYPIKRIQKNPRSNNNDNNNNNNNNVTNSDSFFSDIDTKTTNSDSGFTDSQHNETARLINSSSSTNETKNQKLPTIKRSRLPLRYSKHKDIFSQVPDKSADSTTELNETEEDSKLPQIDSSQGMGKSDDEKILNEDQSGYLKSVSSINTANNSIASDLSKNNEYETNEMKTLNKNTFVKDKDDKKGTVMVDVDRKDANTDVLSDQALQDNFIEKNFVSKMERNQTIFHDKLLDNKNDTSELILIRTQ